MLWLNRIPILWLNLICVFQYCDWAVFQYCLTGQSGYLKARLTSHAMHRWALPSPLWLFHHRQESSSNIHYDFFTIAQPAPLTIPSLDDGGDDQGKHIIAMNHPYHTGTNSITYWCLCSAHCIIKIQSLCTYPEVKTGWKWCAECSQVHWRSIKWSKIESLLWGS